MDEHTRDKNKAKCSLNYATNNIISPKHLHFSICLIIINFIYINYVSSDTSHTKRTRINLNILLTTSASMDSRQFYIFILTYYLLWLFHHFYSTWLSFIILNLIFEARMKYFNGNISFLHFWYQSCLHL